MKHASLHFSPSCTTQRALAALALAGTLTLFCPGATSAQTAVAPKPVTAVDVAAAPADVLNLRKQKYDPVLIRAEAHPYTIPGGGSCAALNREVFALNSALGPDIDEATSLTEQEKRSQAVGGTARSVVGGLIPFGGVIRAISGATAEERRRSLYLYAGSVRRAFLKGYARARGCHIARYVAPPPEKKK